MPSDDIPSTSSEFLDAMFERDTASDDSVNSPPTEPTTTEICVLCGEPIVGWGNNPEPLRSYDDGRACDDCNLTKVIPARLAHILPDRGRWVMVCRWRASDGSTANDGLMLSGCDFDTGIIVWTADPESAMRFENAVDVFRYWQTQSATHPLRRDGHPNRPMTAYTIEPMLLHE